MTELFLLSRANDVRCEGDLIVLEPVRLEKRTEGRQSRADKVRERLADLGITEQDVHEAMEWARDR